MVPEKPSASWYFHTIFSQDNKVRAVKRITEKVKCPLPAHSLRMEGSDAVWSAGNRTLQLCSFWSCQQPGEKGQGWESQVDDVPHVLLLLLAMPAPHCSGLAAGGDPQQTRLPNPQNTFAYPCHTNHNTLEAKEAAAVLHPNILLRGWRLQATCPQHSQGPHCLYRQP